MRDTIETLCGIRDPEHGQRACLQQGQPLNGWAADALVLSRPIAMRPSFRSAAK
jgi:hypothetical protein